MQGALRLYSFLMATVICAQLSIIVCAVLEVNGGPSSTLESSAAQQLQLGISAVLQEQCEISYTHGIYEFCVCARSMLTVFLVCDFRLWKHAVVFR